MSATIISKYLAGWDKLEPVILGTIANGMSPLFLGKHGNGKSSLVRFITDALNANGNIRFRKYSMDKENIVSMIGIPSVEAMKAGKLDYIKHERSIFNADVILLDELTRAPKETQNLVLEILEEKTCFGHPLPYKFVVATANDETYQAAFKLDAALLDRFFVVVPSPTIDGAEGYGPDELKHLIQLNMGGRLKNIAKHNQTLSETINKIRETYQDMWKDTELVNTIIDFASRFTALLLSSLKEMNKGQKNIIYISQRDIGHQFCRVIMAIAAYYKAVNDDPEYLAKGAKDAYIYCLGTKLGIPLDKMSNIFDQLKDMLTSVGDAMAQLKILLTTLPIHDRINMIKVRIDDIRTKMEDDEVVGILGNILQELDISTKKDVDKYQKNVNSLVTLESILSGETKPSLKKVHDQAWLKVAVPAVFNSAFNTEMV